MLSPLIENSSCYFETLYWGELVNMSSRSFFWVQFWSFYDRIRLWLMAVFLNHLPKLDNKTFSLVSILKPDQGWTFWSLVFVNPVNCFRFRFYSSFLFPSADRFNNLIKNSPFSAVWGSSRALFVVGWVSVAAGFRRALFRIDKNVTSSSSHESLHSYSNWTKWFNL